MSDTIIKTDGNLSDEMLRLQNEKKSAIELQARKHAGWDENYSLYRNKVQTNRLTQRQAVNIPLMKETIKTLLSRIDDRPEVEWKELSGDEQKEIYYQEIWNDFVQESNLELIDILDKKNVLLYGFSVKKLNINDKGVEVSVLDPYDILIDPLMLPWDFDSARFLIQQNIFRSVRDILADSSYTEKGKEALKIWSETDPGMTASEEAKKQWEAKMERLKMMGIDHADFANFAGGDRLVNLTEHYTKTWDEKKKKFVRRVITYADDTIELKNDTLYDLIGVDFWPMIYWSEDPECGDVYPDSVADLVRTPNKVINIWFSQLIENRTLRNFQMHWFTPGNGFVPQTYEPGQGRMLPAPPGEDINKVLKPVEISGLDDTLEAINIVTNIVERGSGATAIEKGQSEQGQQTLGEIQVLVGKANERTTAMAKFYRLAWYEFAWKWDELMNANAPKIIKLVKMSHKGKAYPKVVFASDWRSEKGYKPTITSSSEQESESTKGIQKFMFILSQFPNNVALKKIAQKRMLEIVDLTPEELQQVQDGEIQQPMPQEGMQPQNPQQQVAQMIPQQMAKQIATI